MWKQFTVILLAALAVTLLAGCGKSDAQKQMEADLNAELTQLHDTVHAQLGEALMKVQAAIAIHDSLAMVSAKKAKRHTSDDLKTAMAKLNTMEQALAGWVANFKTHDEKMSHAEAIALLNKSKEELAKMKDEVAAATSEAVAAIQAHSADRKELQAGMAKRGKRPSS